MDRGCRKIKVLISMIGLDGHSVGGEVISSILRDAGMEVVYLGTYQTPEMIMQAAIEEDVDVVGISSHASNYNEIIRLVDLMRGKGRDDIIVICGGTIPRQHVHKLKENGVAEVFTPDSTPESIVKYIASKGYERP